MPRDENGSRSAEHTALLYALADFFPFSYVIDLDRFGAVHDAAFRDRFYLGGHLNAAGYRYTALQLEAYIDYIIRGHMADFCQIGFVGGDAHHTAYKW